MMRMCNPRIVLSTARRRGTALVLVLLAIGIGMMVCAVLLSAATTATGGAMVVGDSVQARFAAEAGLDVCMHYIRTHANWRQEKESGEWLSGFVFEEAEVSVTATKLELEEPADLTIDDHSFESQVGALPTPMLNPPMTGTLGSWEVERTALAPTGLTVPTIEVEAAASAPSGANHIVFGFGAAVSGSASVRQELGDVLLPRSRYRLQVDIRRGGLLAFDTRFGFQLFAGNTLVASTNEAATMFDGLTADELQRAADELVNEAAEPATLVETALSGQYASYELVFVTGAAPEPGPISIELFTEFTGILTSIAFDNVRLTVEPYSAVRLTSTGRFNQSSYVTSVVLEPDLAGRYRTTEWTEK